MSSVSSAVAAWESCLDSHTRSRLLVTSTRALLCPGSWNLLGLIRDQDMEEGGKLDKVDGRIELERVAHILCRV